MSTVLEFRPPTRTMDHFMYFLGCFILHTLPYGRPVDVCNISHMVMLYTTSLFALVFSGYNPDYTVR
jgi:hypothetical protein